MEKAKLYRIVSMRKRPLYATHSGSNNIILQSVLLSFVVASHNKLYCVMQRQNSF